MCFRLIAPAPPSIVPPCIGTSIRDLMIIDKKASQVSTFQPSDRRRCDRSRQSTGNQKSGVFEKVLITFREIIQFVALNIDQAYNLFFFGDYRHHYLRLGGPESRQISG